MQLEIISPEKIVFNGEIQMVRVPGGAGSFAVMNNHAPIVSTLEKGQIKVSNNDGQILYFETTGGVIQVLNNKITILIDESPNKTS